MGMDKVANPPKNLEGKRFGPFIVLRRVGSTDSGVATWEVKCVDCGDRSVKYSSNLQRAKRCPRCGIRKDLAGHRSGFLEVIGFSHSEKWKAYWKCKCDCGQEVTLNTNALTSKKANKSCGRCHLLRQPDEVTVKKHVLLKYKNGATKRRLAWQLSDDVAWTIVCNSCYWCGAAPEMRKMWEADRRNRTIEYPLNGIDRLDSRKGYVTDNVVTSCTQCNRAKGDLSPQEFLEHVAKIVNYQNKISGSLK